MFWLYIIIYIVRIYNIVYHEYYRGMQNHKILHLEIQVYNLSIEKWIQCETNTNDKNNKPFELTISI